MSHRCLAHLNDSQRDGLCGAAQNGHLGLLFTVIAGFLQQYEMMPLVELQKRFWHLKDV